MKLLKSLSLTLALGLTAPAFAKVIQIIHTNDLHSYFQGTRGGIGGYAQLKKVIDELRQEATTKGIPTLHLDAGDFGEGSTFYFSNQGVDSLRALDLLGIDVTVIGNHDFILGGTELRDQIKAAKMKATILSANMRGKTFMGLKGLVKDYIDYDIDGLKVRIFGLTTNEIHYMYPLRPLGWISNPHNSGIAQAERAQRGGVDVLIALTHIGLQHDIDLVRKSSTIDLVVGGHDHIRLPRPELTKNMNGRMVPIVQAGAHSGYVGSMIIDMQPQGESKILEYRMIDIEKNMPQDPQMKAFAEQVYQNREDYFGGRKWDEVIGYSNIVLNGNYNGQDTATHTCWSHHMARLNRTIASTELGLQFDVFQGEQIAPGPITFGDVIDNFPHFRKWGDQGWNIAKAKVSGFLLKEILDLMASSEVALQVTIDGVKVMNKDKQEVSFNPRINHSSEALVDGVEIENMRFYSVGLPSEVPFGIEKLAGIFSRLLLNKLEYLEGTNYWPILEDYVRANSPLNCLEN